MPPPIGAPFCSWARTAAKPRAPDKIIAKTVFIMMQPPFCILLYYLTPLFFDLSPRLRGFFTVLPHLPFRTLVIRSSPLWPPCFLSSRCQTQGSDDPVKGSRSPCFSDSVPVFSPSNAAAPGADRQD